jgi:signal peptidase II
LIAFLGGILLILGDQFTKSLAVQYLQSGNTVELIPGVFELNYTINKGAAFGILQNHQVLFMILTVCVLVCLVVLYCKIPMQMRYRPLQIVLVFLIAGAIGNLIDRCYLGYVVDFLYFKLINFPIFNVADCYVTVSAVVLVALLLFYYREEDMELILCKDKK